MVVVIVVDVVVIVVVVSLRNGLGLTGSSRDLIFSSRQKFSDEVAKNV